MKLTNNSYHYYTHKETYSGKREKYMPFITWNETMSVGVERFDTQHKKLVELVNTLFDAMRQGKGKSVMGKVFDELIAYTTYHFASEEELMEKYGYPGFVQHKEEHEALTQQVKELREKYEQGELFITIETLDFLKAWLSNHILKTDMQYKPFFRNKGVR